MDNAAEIDKGGMNGFTDGVTASGWRESRKSAMYETRVEYEILLAGRKCIEPRRIRILADVQYCP
jgi:hypothetical protein